MPSINLGQRELYYHYMGQPGFNKGKVLIFLHGAGGNHRIWEKNLSALSQSHSPMALDLPGHGLSKGQGCTSIEEYREFVKEFVDVLGLKKVVLAGHSMGGGVVQSFALAYPNLLAGMILIGSGARLRVAPQIIEGLKEAVSTGVIPSNAEWAYSPNTSKDVIDKTEELLAPRNPAVQLGDMLACDKFDAISTVTQLKLPLLVICGRDDKLTPVKYADFYVKNMPQTVMKVIDDAGHMVMVEKAEEMNQSIMDFLNKM